jgi:hypothetical protein
MFLAKITGKAICKKMNIYCVKGVAACCHTLHTIYVHVLQIVLPVILTRNMSAP